VSFTQDLFTQRRNYQDGNVRIGQLDRIWYDEHRNAFYIGDGTTPGGRLIGAGAIGTQYYGSFYDTTALQTISNVSIGYTITISNTYASYGVSLNSSNIVFAHTGVYEITFSIQFDNSNNVRQRINVWFEQNGVTVDDSNSQFQIENNTAGIEGRMIAVTPFITSVSSGDRLAIKWNATNTGIHIATLPPAGDIPRTPGVIVTVKQL
jgi:hypothetical protein